LSVQCSTWHWTDYKIIVCAYVYTHSGVNLCGNGWERSSHTFFRWERRSHTYSYFLVGTQFLQCSVTISIRPTLVAQQTTIVPLMNVFIYLQAVLRIKLGPVIAPDRHSNCPHLFPFPSLFPLPFPLPILLPFPGTPPLPSNTASGSGGALGAPPAGPGRVQPPNVFWCILVQKIFAFWLP